MAKASEGGSLVTLRRAGDRDVDVDAGWESEHDSGMAAALAASLRETEPTVRVPSQANLLIGQEGSRVLQSQPFPSAIRAVNPVYVIDGWKSSVLLHCMCAATGTC